MQDPTMNDELIRVDEEDRELCAETKEICHRLPLRLHRAFSVFLFHGDGRLLLTLRSDKKFTWPGHWSNTCCSHPRWGESTREAAHRRLGEELGISAEVRYLFKSVYRAEYDATWGEHECDHVYVGRYDGTVEPDPAEVADWKYVEVEALREDMERSPERYTPWFRMLLNRVLEEMSEKAGPA